MLLAAIAALGCAGDAAATTYANPANITINDGFPPPTTATPYPSTIGISGVSGTITKLTVTINGFNHNFPDDVDMLLVGPTGANAIIWSDVGGNRDFCVGTATNNPSCPHPAVTITLDDAAAASLPDATQLASGTFKPTNAPPDDLFPAPAPTPSGGSALSVFNGTDPNGTWSLYVTDDNVADSGNITGGWSLTISQTPTAVTLASASAVRATRGVAVRWRTGTEAGVLGFRVYRGNVLLTKRLLPAQGMFEGTRYAYVDRRAPPNGRLRYRVEAVGVDGAGTWREASVAG